MLSAAELRAGAGRGANLHGAHLRRADLSGADLSGADLSWAILEGADLYGANLSGSNLSGAALSGADLSRAILEDADLSGADLRDTCLDPDAPIPKVKDWGGMELRGNYVIGWRSKRSVHVGTHEYTPGLHEAPVFSVSRHDCHPGIYLASKQWLDSNGYGPERVRVVALKSEVHRAGDKYRAKRVWVLGGYGDGLLWRAVALSEATGA